MRYYILPENGNFYKANLHCHSTVSDGQYTPEQIKKSYMEHGYSIVAYTDHEIVIPHHDLDDENFLALTGTEIGLGESNTDYDHHRACHICLIALDYDNQKQIWWSDGKYTYPNSKEYFDLVDFDKNEPDKDRTYSPKTVNAIIKDGKDNGYFVTYNHPTWSMEDYRSYSCYEGMDAMEIRNWGSTMDGFNEYNSHVYDDLLRQGKMIYCIAADDNHRYNQQFGGFVMIKADKLEYKTITDALKNGSFYASEGPEIKELYIENGLIHVTCSEVAAIHLISDFRWGKRYQGQVSPFTSADIPIYKGCKWIRLELISPSGKRAYTNVIDVAGKL